MSPSIKIKKHFFNVKVGLLVQHSLFFERFDQFPSLKNEFENLNFEMFEEIVQTFGKSDDDMIL